MIRDLLIDKPEWSFYGMGQMAPVVKLARPVSVYRDEIFNLWEMPAWIYEEAGDEN